MTRQPPAPPISAPWWRPDRYARKRPFLAGRAAMIEALRHTFRARDFLEVDTPALQVSPGLEPHLMAFETELRGPHPDDRRRLYLHTSPEFAMKKLLVAGLPRIFQMSHVFRNGERAATHHPEFTMLEWYRVGAGTEALIEDCQALLQAALAAVPQRDRLTWQGREADPLADWQVLSVAAAMERHAGIDIAPSLADPARPDVAALGAQSARLGLPARPGDDWDDLFFRIFLDHVEPKLGLGAPTVLTDYPIHMAALSRPKPGAPHLAERFELYVCGLELANGFGELTDPVEQRRRFEADMALKEALYGVRYPIDEDFLAALAHGLPESAGIALGVDRLAMLVTGALDIEDVLWAPVVPATAL